MPLRPVCRFAVFMALGSGALGAAETILIGGQPMNVQVTPADPNEESPEVTLFGQIPQAVGDATGTSVAATAAAPTSAPASAPRSGGGGTATPKAPVGAVIMPQPAGRTPSFTGVGGGGLAVVSGAALPVAAAGSSAPPRPETPWATTVLSADGALVMEGKRRDLLVALQTGPAAVATVRLQGVLEAGGVDAVGAQQRMNLPALVTGLGLAVVPGTVPQAVMATSDAGGVVQLRMAAFTTAADLVWGEPVGTPLTLPDPQDLAAAVMDVDRDGIADLLLAGLSRTAAGPTLQYAVGFGLTATGVPARWSVWMSVAQTLSTGTVAIEIDGGQTTLNPKPEVLIHVLATEASQVTLRTLVGVNATVEGTVEGWLIRDQRLGETPDRVTGLATGAWKDHAEGTDVGVLWIEQSPSGAFGSLAVLNNLPLAPPYKPTPADLEARGDVATDLSVAAVKAQQVAGIRSPFQLKARLEPALVQWRLQRQLPSESKVPKSDLLPMIATTLDAIEPKIPDAVRPELTKLILTLYGYSPEVGL